MKKIMFIVIILIIAIKVNAQLSDTIYYDINWKTVNSSSKVEYYKVINKTDTNFIVNGYYKDGKIQLKGTYLDKMLKCGIGNIYYYYHDGSLKAIDSWDNGNIKNQIWKYPSGKIKSTGGFLNIGKLDSVVLRIFGDWEFYTEDGKLVSKGNYNKNGRDGIWEIYSLNGNLMSHNYYKDGKLIKIELAHPENKIYYEYDIIIDNYGKTKIKPYILEKTDDEYKITGQFMAANADFYKLYSTTVEAILISEYVILWTSNAPFLGKFIINTNKFIYTYNTIPVKKDKEISLCILLGNCGYKINNFENYDVDDSYIYVAKYMAEWYENRLSVKPECKNELMDDLLKAYKKNKINKYIESFN